MTTPQIPPAFLSQAAQPAPQPVPQPEPVQLVDLTPEIQRQRDALPKPTTFSLLGVQITLPPIQALSFETQLRVGNDELGTLISILGDDQAQRLAQAGAQISDLMVLFAAWQKASGLEPGESAASTGS